MKKCVIIGASHSGVNCAFALRKEGWGDEIILIDSFNGMMFFGFKQHPIQVAILPQQSAHQNTCFFACVDRDPFYRLAVSQTASVNILSSHQVVQPVAQIS